MNIEFAWLWAFALLPLPLLVYLLLPGAPQAPLPSLRVPFFQRLQGSGRTRQGRRTQRALLFLMLPAWLLLLTAAARPLMVGEPVSLPVSGRDLMLAVDLSMSMQTEDMLIRGREMDRLSAVKIVAGEFIQRRETDRLGLILFGDRAYLQAPLTFDRTTVHTLLDEAVLGMAGEKTAMGDAIGLGLKRLRDSRIDNRVMVLLTDGANTAGSIEPLKAAELAANEGVRIYTVGVGADYRTVDGIFGTRRIAGADLDEATLKSIAEKTGGRYFRARNLEELQDIYRTLDKIEPVADDEMRFRPVDEMYHWPLAAALLLAALTLLLQRLGWRARRRKEAAHVG